MHVQILKFTILHSKTVRGIFSDGKILSQKLKNFKNIYLLIVTGCNAYPLQDFKCPSAFHYFEGKCLMRVPELKTFEEAKTHCSAFEFNGQHAILAEPRTEIMYVHMKMMSWISGVFPGNVSGWAAGAPGTWIGLTKINGLFVWGTDNVTLTDTFSKWQSVPSTSSLNNCVTIFNSGGWVDSSCTAKRTSFCQLDALNQYNPAKDQCPDGYHIKSK